MSVTDQPSVLTVCLARMAAEPGVLDLNEILAAREQAAARCDGVGRDEIVCDRVPCGRHACDSTASDSNTSGASGEACDDSACGMNVASDGSSREPAGRLVDADGRKFSDAVCNGETANGTASASGVASAVGASFFHADSGKKALELLRMLRFDLLVTGDRLPDMPVGQFIRRVRFAWPWQKWAMVGTSLTTEDEIDARALGAMAVFDAPPDWEALSALAATAADRAAGLRYVGSQMREASALGRVDQEPMALDRSAPMDAVPVTAGGSRRGTAKRSAG